MVSVFNVFCTCTMYLGDVFFYFNVLSFYLGRGTGRRHRVSTWPVSPLTGRSHKMIIPAESPDKKVLILNLQT